MVRVVIHCNPGLRNQTESAFWLRSGFRKHGLNAEITCDRDQRGNVNVVQGPWWAYKQLLGADNVLFLDRCFYGHARFDLSLGWLRADGSRDFMNCGMGRPKGVLPELKTRKPHRGSAVVFGDYGRDATEDVQATRRKYERVYFRPHPADKNAKAPALTIGGDLANVWALCDVAVGHSSTVLVEAEINGLRVDSSDPRHVVQNITDREQWLTDLSWAQWHYDEIQRGEFWEHLSDGRAFST